MNPARATAAAILAAAATLAACAPAPKPVRVERAAPQPAPVTQEDRELVLGDPLRPILTRGQRGIEVHWLLADDRDHAVRDALAPHARRQTPADTRLLERWRQSGLRLVRVPLDDMDALRERLTPVGDWRRAWFGTPARWTEVFRGRRVNRGALLVLDDGIREVDDDAVLRLLARCWAAPSPAGAVLRLELAFQQHVARRVSAAEVFAEPRRPAAEQAGEVYRRLTLETVLEPGWAYVVTSADPDDDWTRDGSDDSGEPPPGVLEDDLSAPIGPGLGPVGSAPRPLGEAMLLAEDPGSGAPARVVLMIVPRSEGRFRLLSAGGQ